MTDTVQKTATIVVCEDDDATLDLLCEHLVADGYEVLPAPTATDALRLCRYNRPDLMLLDLALPDASGLDVLKDIRGADADGSPYDPQLPIIVLSGRSADSVGARAVDLGADDYVQKPFSYEKLRSRVQVVLGRRPPQGIASPTREREYVGRLAEELVKEVIRTTMVLEDVVSNLLPDLPADAFPGEDKGEALLEMVFGSVAPAVAEAGADICVIAITLVVAIRERVLEDLRTAAEMVVKDGR